MRYLLNKVPISYRANFITTKLEEKVESTGKTTLGMMGISSAIFGTVKEYM